MRLTLLFLIKTWCLLPDSNWHEQSSTDFKSAVSTDSTKQAKYRTSFLACLWRRVKSAPEFDAFSLVEVAIVLVIVGILSSVFVSPFLNLQKVEKQRITSQRFENAMTSLTSFLLTHRYLPCPANPKNKGIEAGVAMKSCMLPGTNVGILPYKTLGIPETQARDGFHQWITYAVVAELTDSFVLKELNTQDETYQKREVFCEVQPYTPIAIYNHRFESALSLDEEKDCVAFVLVSHGPKGILAYGMNGGRQTLLGVSPSEHKKMNADDTRLEFADGPVVLDPLRLSDDRVAWITRNNLMASYGKIPCHPRSIR